MNERNTTYTIIGEADINNNADQEQQAAAISKTRSLLTSWRSRFAGDVISKTYPYNGGMITLHSVTPDSLTVSYSVDKKPQEAYQFDRPSGELYGMAYAENGAGTPVTIDDDTYERVSLALFECDKIELRADQETENNDPIMPP